MGVMYMRHNLMSHIFGDNKSKRPPKIQSMSVISVDSLCQFSNCTCPILVIGLCKEINVKRGDAVILGAVFMNNN